MNADQEDEEWPQYEEHNGYNTAQYEDKQIDSPKICDQQDDDDDLLHEEPQKQEEILIPKEDE